MSFMPNPGSVVRLRDGRIAIVVNVTPNGRADSAWTGTEEVKVSPDDIATVFHEPSLGSWRSES